MKKRILSSIFSSGLQAIAVQVLGVLFIIIVAKAVSKDEFGIIQWANAAAMFMTTILSFGMEQVVVRRIAASRGSDWAAAAFLFHNFIGSVIAFSLTLIVAHYFPGANEAIAYLPLFFAAQAVIFLVTPIKSYLNAKHLFTPYGIIAVVSNSLKIILSAVLISRGIITVTNVGNILLVSAALELIAILIYVRVKTSFSLKFRLLAYKKLLRESMPQYFSVIFDISLSRLDYLLLGMLGTFAVTAEYGIAYRAYELGRLPVVIIAPVILNIFARMMNSKLTPYQKKVVNELYNVEIFAAMFIPLILNTIWSPMLNAFFDNKYGSANSMEFLILSVCIPLHFFINLMWTITFAARKYRKIATVTMFTAVLNLTLNLILIPYLQGIGAALAYLCTTLFQAVIYYALVRKHFLNIPLFTLFRFLIVAALTYYVVIYHINIHFMYQLLLLIVIYSLTCFLLGWIRIKHFKDIKSYISK